MTTGDHLARELALLKLQVAADQQDAAAQVVHRSGGKVLSTEPAWIVEIAGTEDMIAEVIATLSAFGEIVEVVRGGVLGISRTGRRAPTAR